MDGWSGGWRAFLWITRCSLSIDFIGMDLVCVCGQVPNERTWLLVIEVIDPLCSVGCAPPGSTWLVRWRGQQKKTYIEQCQHLNSHFFSFLPGSTIGTGGCQWASVSLLGPRLVELLCLVTALWTFLSIPSPSDSTLVLISDGILLLSPDLEHHSLHCWLHWYRRKQFRFI